MGGITMKITKKSIMAADDFGGDDSIFDDEEGFEEDVENADAEETEEDDNTFGEEENIEEDDVAIDIDNNIVNHLIAECENCKGIFISAMIASDQDIESINGICPLCNKDTTQTLKWIIKDYPE